MSIFEGRVCPKRNTASRSTPFFSSASVTRRTELRSSDQKCSRHLPCSDEIEYFARSRSNVTAPSSMTTALRESEIKSCRVRASVSDCTSRLSRSQPSFECDPAMPLATHAQNGNLPSPPARSNSYGYCCGFPQRLPGTSCGIMSSFQDSSAGLPTSNECEPRQAQILL